MGQSKTTSQLANKATPALTDKLYLSDASTTPPSDKYTTVAQLLTTPSLSKIYDFLFSQSATSNPVITEVRNELGTVTWARSSEGVYTATTAGLWTVDKTFTLIPSPIWFLFASNTFGVLFFQLTSVNTITLITGAVTITGGTGVLTFVPKDYSYLVTTFGNPLKMPLNIKVYL